jgi:hypothetical protein
VAGRRPHLEAAAERGEAVGHVPQAGTERGAGRVVPGSVVRHGEAQAVRGDAQRDARRGGARVLGGILQRLEAAEVDGCLGLLREPPDRVGRNGHRHRGLARLRGQGGDQSGVREQRRVDAAGEVAEVLKRARRVGPQLGKQLPGLTRITVRRRGEQVELDRQRDQVLLRAVVQVPLKPPPRLVLRGHQALP